MKQFLRLMATLVVIFVAEPVKVSSAVERLPIGNAETVVEDARYRLDALSIHISVLSSSGEFIGNTYGTVLTFYKRPDGSEESIGELTRRSLTELEALIGTALKKGLEATIEKNAAKLVGREVLASYRLETPVIDWNPWKGGHTLIRDDYESDVFQSPPTIGDIPPTLYTVNLVESLKRVADRQTYPFTVPGIARAQITEEDENGNIIKVADSVEATLADIFGAVNWGVDYPLVYHEDDTLFVPLLFALSGKGTLRIWYRDGSEQVFRRQDGEGLITYLSPPVAPPAKRLGVPRVTASGVELPYESTDDEQVLIKRASPDFKVWEPLYSLPVYPPIVPTKASPASGSLPVRIRTATAPLDANLGFYKAEVVSPVVPQ